MNFNGISYPFCPTRRKTKLKDRKHLITSVSQHTRAAQPLSSVQLLSSSSPHPFGRLCQAAIEAKKVNIPPLHRGTSSLPLPPPPSKNGFQVCWLSDLGFVGVSGYNSTANRRRTRRTQHLALDSARIAKEKEAPMINKEEGIRDACGKNITILHKNTK